MSVNLKRKKDQFDVIVVGGGMSGVCAAVACARGGARTALVHERAVFGGNASSEIRMHICGASTNSTKPNAEETGIVQEILLENKRVNDFHNYSIWDRVLYQTARTQDNLTLFLNTTMTDAVTESSLIRSIYCYQMTTEIHWELSAPLFVDCTGNGTLGYLAGAEFRTGSESRAEFDEPHAPETANKERMGNTLLFKAIDRGEPVKFIKPEWAYTFTEEQLKYRRHADAKPMYSALPEENYCTALLDNVPNEARELAFDAYCLDYGYWWIEVPGQGDDIIEEYEEIRDELVKCVYGIWDHIKNGGDHGAVNYDLLWVGMLPGIRESRRMAGDYMLNENDILGNRIFDDAVAYGGWPIDNHVPRGLFDFDKLPSFIYNFSGFYTIPYRSYYSKNVGNLMFAGRNISASKLAMASTRVMGTCSVGGQAVGTAAAMCVRYGCAPRDLATHMRELQQRLLRDDCYIPGFTNNDENDILRLSSVSASSEAPGGSCRQVLNGISRETEGSLNRWESCGISAQGETLTFQLDKPQLVRQVRLTFDPNLSRSIKITLSSKRIAQQQPGIPAELVKDYTVTLFRDGREVRKSEVRDNYRRLNVIEFDAAECDRIEVRVRATNGAPNARIFEARAY